MSWPRALRRSEIVVTAPRDEMSGEQHRACGNDSWSIPQSSVLCRIFAAIVMLCTSFEIFCDLYFNNDTKTSALCTAVLCSTMHDHERQTLTYLCAVFFVANSDKKTFRILTLFLFTHVDVFATAGLRLRKRFSKAITSLCKFTVVLQSKCNYFGI